MKYLPFLNGSYSTAPGLQITQHAKNAADRLIFQLDSSYADYLENKKQCRAENLGKYYVEDNLPTATAVAANKCLVAQLTKEYPTVFSLATTPTAYCLKNNLTGAEINWHADWLQTADKNYQTLFDALCCQVPEDVAICQLTPEQDWLAAIHLCAPNYWAPHDKIGKPFNVVHGNIPGMEKTNQHYFKMLELLVQKGPFTRFAWGLATDKRLNHHPEPPPGFDPLLWQGRQIQPDTPQIYVRVERQNTIGLPAVNAFIFTIRTYFYEANTLQQPEKAALWAAVESMSEASLQYKGLYGQKEALKQWLAL